MDLPQFRGHVDDWIWCALDRKPAGNHVLAMSRVLRLPPARQIRDLNFRRSREQRLYIPRQERFELSGSVAVVATARRTICP